MSDQRTIHHAVTLDPTGMIYECDQLHSIEVAPVKNRPPAITCLACNTLMRIKALRYMYQGKTYQQTAAVSRAGEIYTTEPFPKKEQP